MKIFTKLAVAACIFLWGCEASQYDDTAKRWAYLQTNYRGQCVAIDSSWYEGVCLTRTISNPDDAAKAVKAINEALAKARSYQIAMPGDK